MARACASSIPRPSSVTSEPFFSIRPRKVASIAFGCSWISFIMKCSKPPFSASSRLHSTRFGARSTFVPSSFVRNTSFAVRVAISPSCISTTSRACMRMAGMSLAASHAPSPRPRTSGESCFATTMRSGSWLDTTAIAYAPTTCESAKRTASSSVATFVSPSATRCATISVSVSLENRTPRASISRRSVAWFSMMPL